MPSPVSDWMNQWVSERRGGVVEIRVPQRGDLAKLRKMADANAKFHVDMNIGKTSTNIENYEQDRFPAQIPH